MNRTLLALVVTRAVFATPTLAPDQLKPGEKGYGLTAFRGTKPERFDVEIVDVAMNFLPKQDLILIRMDHPIIRKAGIIAGMSGSPVFVRNRLIGAVAYGFPFSTEPIAGVTPIHNIIATTRMPARGIETTPFAWNAGRWLPRGVRRLFDSPLSSGMQRVSVPLSVAGFPQDVIEDIDEIFTPLGMRPVVGGGTGSDDKGPKSFQPGGPIGVQLARGDMSMVGTGTVTYMEKNRVAGFGHPFFSAGEMYVPVVAATVHMVIPNVMRSFKVSSPLRQLGTLIHDRQACIVGEIGRKVEMLPVRLEVKGSTGGPEVFHVELARNRNLTPMIANVVALAGVRTALSDIADAITTVKGRLRVRDHGWLTFESRSFSRAGIDIAAISGSRPLIALRALLDNPFGPAVVQRLDMEVSAEFRSDFGEVVGLQLPGPSVDPGSRIDVRTTVRPYDGPEETVVIPIDIPRTLAGQNVRVEVASGGLVEPDRATPENLEDLIRYLEKDYPNDALVVSIYKPDRGVALRGEVLPDLPRSVLHVLRPGASSRGGQPRTTAKRIVVPHKRIVFGRAQVNLQVRKEVLR